jgi:hypothetical protein
MTRSPWRVQVDAILRLDGYGRDIFVLQGRIGRRLLPAIDYREAD